MEKYRSVAEKKLANKKGREGYKVHPEALAQQAHVQGEFATKAMDDFFTEAYGDVLVDLFVQWLQTEPHETKTREFLYSTAMGLGSLREKLISIQTYGKNLPALKQMEEHEQT